jgi:co-chaperonin GroES (HSP10)
MKIKPINNTVLVEPVANDDHIGKIIIPHKEVGVPYKGKVINVSEDFEYDSVHKGDIVVFKRFKEMRLANDLWVINGENIIGVINC